MLRTRRHDAVGPRSAGSGSKEGGSRSTIRCPEMLHWSVCVKNADAARLAATCVWRATAGFARSHGKAPTHASFDGLKALHAAVRARIPPS